MKLIPLHGKYGERKFALVDDEDYEIISTFRWRLGRDGYPLGSVYIRRFEGRDVTMSFRMHRLVFPRLPQIDHINGDRLDNRRSNLRECTSSENRKNSKTSNSTGFKGVERYGNPNRPWRSRIWVGGAAIHLGYFGTIEEAAKAYDKAAKRHHGKFARLNFPDYD